MLPEMLTSKHILIIDFLQVRRFLLSKGFCYKLHDKNYPVNQIFFKQKMVILVLVIEKVKPQAI